MRSSPPQKPGRRLLTRRRFLATLLGAPALAGLYAWRVEPHWVEFVSRDLPVRGLPPALDGARLVHLSDLHVGPRVDPRFLIETFRRVRDLQPEFLAVTGDWISYHGQADTKQLVAVLAHAPRGRLGTFGILGNHDWGPVWRVPAVAERVTRIAQEAGFAMLRNEVAERHGLRVVGLDDLWSPGFAPEKVAAAQWSGPATIALCHNPDAADQPIWSTFRGWILAGHTHGGQCRPPFLPPPLLPVKNKRYTAGAFDVGGGRTLYINRGLGHLIRVRFNVRPEVTVFRLTTARDG